jgi:hypothetical protein
MNQITDLISKARIPTAVSGVHLATSLLERGVSVEQSSSTKDDSLPQSTRRLATKILEAIQVIEGKPLSELNHIERFKYMSLISEFVDRQIKRKLIEQLVHEDVAPYGRK